MSEIQNISAEFFIVSFTMPLILAVVLIWFVISYQKRKYKYELEKKDHEVKEQQLIIDKQKAVVLERERIASEMHDDLGAGLTTICFLSEKAIRNTHDSLEKEQIEKISNQASSLVKNMSEIIWAMNSRFDTVIDFIGYIRRYASEYLNDNQLDLDFKSASIDSEIPLSAEKRRNLFLVIKEILHNAVKYSQASKIEIEVMLDDDLKISITELNGIGFNSDEKSGKGNGLYNINKRMKLIGGSLVHTKTGNGMNTLITYPLSA